MHNAKNEIILQSPFETLLKQGLTNGGELLAAIWNGDIDFEV